MIAFVNSLVLLLPPISRVLAYMTWELDDDPFFLKQYETYRARLNSAIDSIRNTIGMLIKSKVTQHHHRAQDHSGRIGNIASSDISTNVTTALEKEK